MRLVIVGGVAAGTKAASRARRVDPESGDHGLPGGAGALYQRVRPPLSPLRRRGGTRRAHRPHPRAVRREGHRGAGAPPGREPGPRREAAPRPRPGHRRGLRGRLRPPDPRHRRAGRPPPYPRRGPRRHLRAPLPHRRRQTAGVHPGQLPEAGGRRWRRLHRARGRGEPVRARDGGRARGGGEAGLPSPTAPRSPRRSKPASRRRVSASSPARRWRGSWATTASRASASAAGSSRPTWSFSGSA